MMCSGKGCVIITYRNGSLILSDYISRRGSLSFMGDDMKEDCKFFGIRKNPDPDHVPEIKHEQIMSRSDAELLEWICTTGYDEALKELEKENGKQ